MGRDKGEIWDSVAVIHKKRAIRVGVSALNTKRNGYFYSRSCPLRRPSIWITSGRDWLDKNRLNKQRDYLIKSRGLCRGTGDREINFLLLHIVRNRPTLFFVRKIKHRRKVTAVRSDKTGPNESPRTRRKNVPRKSRVSNYVPHSRSPLLYFLPHCGMRLVRDPVSRFRCVFSPHDFFRTSIFVSPHFLFPVRNFGY